MPATRPNAGAQAYVNEMSHLVVVRLNAGAQAYANEVSKIGVPRPSSGPAHAYGYENVPVKVMRPTTGLAMSYAVENAVAQPNPGKMWVWSAIANDYVRVPWTFYNPTTETWQQVV